MCRWLAYSGAPILLEEVVLKTEHSLIDQSLHSQQGATLTNGDGFSDSVDAIRDIAPETRKLSSNARAIVSEPLSNLKDVWIMVEESTSLSIVSGEVACREFEPEAP